MRPQDQWYNPLKDHFRCVCNYMRFSPDDENAFALELNTRQDKYDLSFNELINIAETWNKRSHQPDVPPQRDA